MSQPHEIGISMLRKVTAHLDCLIKIQTWVTEQEAILETYPENAIANKLTLEVLKSFFKETTA